VSIRKCLGKRGRHHLPRATDGKAAARNPKQRGLGGFDEKLCYERHGVDIDPTSGSLKAFC